MSSNPTMPLMRPALQPTPSTRRNDRNHFLTATTASATTPSEDLPPSAPILDVTHDNNDLRFAALRSGKGSPMTITTDTTTTTDTSDNFTDRLDSFEGNLPPIPRQTLRLARATTRRVNDVACSVNERVGEFAEPLAQRATTAIKTVVGQGRSAIDRSIAQARKGKNETIGQLGAQAEQTIETLRDGTKSLLTDATRAVAPETVNPASLSDLSKAELYERAQARDIEGRSSMSKTQLIEALRST